MILYDESIHHEKGKFDLGFTEYLFRQQQARTNSKLKGNYKDFYSIRINNQWRIIFKWNKGNSEQVEIIDYH